MFRYLSSRKSRAKKEIRFLMLGLDNAGKSTIVKRICGGNITEISPTMGFNISTHNHNGSTIDIWDVGGQKSLRAYWSNYFQKTDGLIWVVDSSDLRRLAMCKEELDKLIFEEKLAGSTLLIFCNKSDLPGSLVEEKISNFLDLQKIQNRHWNIISCSAITGDGIREGIQWLIDDIEAKLFTIN